MVMVVIVLVLSVLILLSFCVVKLGFSFFAKPDWPVTGEVARSTASILAFLLCVAGPLYRGGDGCPAVLSTSVTSPISERIVPFPYIMGVVGVKGADDPYPFCWSYPICAELTANILCKSEVAVTAAWALFHIMNLDLMRASISESGELPWP